MPVSATAKFVFTALAIVGLGAAPAWAQAQAPVETASAAAEPASEDDDAWAFDLWFGAALTSEYISKGITETDHEPAIQPYIEPSFGFLYAGVWASNVDYLVPDPDFEIDLYAGMRPELGPVSTDLAFLHYIYPGDSGSNYSEVTAEANISPTDLLTLGGRMEYAWDYVQTGGDSTYLEATAALSLPHDFSASAAVGYQAFGSETELSDYLTWNVGASYEWNAVTFDLRYHDTDLSRDTCGAEYTRANSCDARIVATVSVDTSWNTLRGVE